MTNRNITLALGAIGLLISLVSVLLNWPELAIVGLTLAAVSFGIDLERSTRD